MVRRGWWASRMDAWDAGGLLYAALSINGNVWSQASQDESVAKNGSRVVTRAMLLWALQNWDRRPRWFRPLALWTMWTLRSNLRRSPIRGAGDEEFSSQCNTVGSTDLLLQLFIGRLQLLNLCKKMIYLLFIGAAQVRLARPSEERQPGQARHYAECVPQTIVCLVL